MLKKNSHYRVMCLDDKSYDRLFKPEKQLPSFVTDVCLGKDKGETCLLFRDNTDGKIHLLRGAVEREFDDGIFFREAGADYLVLLIDCKAGGEQENPDILFRVKSSPACNFLGGSGGDSLTVWKDGTVEYQRYILWAEVPIDMAVVSPNSEVAGKIREFLNRRKEIIEKIPENLDNGTLDGSHDTYIFDKKHISAWTIQRIDPEEIRKVNPHYYEEYRENIIFENQVLDLTDEILGILVGFPEIRKMLSRNGRDRYIPGKQR